jgi:two-component system NtrC family sensor kinase
MRLLTKITSVIMLGIIVLLAIDGFLSIRRDIDLFNNDMANDGLLLARAMRDLVATTWESSGEEKALELIRQANRGEQKLKIRWVWLDAPEGGPFAPRLPREKIPNVLENHELSYKLTVGATGYQLTYVTVPVGGKRVGALEISEPLVALRRYMRGTIIRTSLLTAGMVLLSSILLWALGLHLVGQPLNRLVEKTVRVGTGDFKGDLALPGKEELSDLADALNDMCRHLDDAREAVRRETEARIETLEQLRHAERLATLGRLSSGLAHELGTPLNVVAGRAKIIATEDLDREEIVSFSKTIMDQADRMTKIIRQLLDFARRRSSEKTRVDMGQLARQVVDLLDVTARKSGTSLFLEGNLEPPTASVDRGQMQQVLINLIMNGIQAMPEGGNVVVRLSVEKVQHPSAKDHPRKSHLAIAVEDEGEGIPRENIRIIFDPFFTTKGVGKGTGLGLSIAYGIVEENGGWIDVQSEPGNGSRFTVYLPLEEK